MGSHVKEGVKKHDTHMELKSYKLEFFGKLIVSHQLRKTMHYNYQCRNSGKLVVSHRLRKTMHYNYWCRNSKDESFKHK